MWVCLQNGWTPLHCSAKAGHLQVVTQLVEAGAGTGHETKDGKVALCFAASSNHSDVISYLLSKEHSTQSLMDDKKVLQHLLYAICRC